MTDDYKVRDDEIDLIHYLDLKASLAGRNDVGHSPPFDVNNGPRHQPKTQSGKPNSPCLIQDDLALPRSVSPSEEIEK